MENYKNHLSFRNKLYRFLFRCVFAVARIFPGKSGNLLSIFILRIFGAQIGKGCIVYPSATIWSPKNLILGNYCVIGPKANIYSVDKVVLGNGVQISQEANLVTASHNYTSKSHELITGPIIIGNNSWVAQKASVLMNVTVGSNCVIAFGSIVTKSVDSNWVLGGIPAKKIKRRILI